MQRSIRTAARRVLMTAAIAALPAPVLAGEGDAGQMRISVQVPEICSLASAPVAVAEAGQFARADLFESCNTDRGFQVLAAHRPLASDESASVTYDGTRSALGREGLSLVAFRRGARHGPVPVSVAADALDAPLAVSFALTPV